MFNQRQDRPKNPAGQALPLFVKIALIKSYEKIKVYRGKIMGNILDNMIAPDDQVISDNGNVTISANTLFHFTGSFDNLLSILKYEFYPRYSLEDYSMFHDDKSVRYRNSNKATPMICFCDIPLSQISNHVIFYGKYALGLSKQWGIDNSISPVMYTLPNSIFSTVMKLNFDGIQKCIHRSNRHFGNLHRDNPDVIFDEKDNIIDEQSEELARIDSGLLEIISFTKPYEGNFVRNGKTYSNVRFYDEREWRYVPDPNKLFDESVPGYITREQFLDKEQLATANKTIESYFKLSFEPKDIKYIIVNNNDEILATVDKINEIKGSKYTYNDLRLLSTKIISMEQILQDF